MNVEAAHDARSGQPPTDISFKSCLQGVLLKCVSVSHDMAHFSDELTRTNVTLPSSLLAQVDLLAGPRGRSRYVAEAVAQRVRRDALGLVIRETAGAMVGKRGWMSPDEVVRWVDGLRSEETDQD